MSFGTNLQYLRRLHNGMTQEDLAEKMQVSRQTISKWELDDACPEMEKVMELCRLFSCSMDRLVMGDMNLSDPAYTNLRLEEAAGFRYLPYTVLSPDPEGDAIRHVQQWAAERGEEKPRIIGWDFPYLSQKQINVFHMHGYTAAWVLPAGKIFPDLPVQERRQPAQRYAAITIRGPMKDPFRLIPNGYRVLKEYMRVNRLEHRDDREVLSCFEWEYVRDSAPCMDIYIAVQ